MIPAFGLVDPAADYVLRPGGYVVVFNGTGDVAVVSAPGGLFLPGGGQDGHESPEEAAIREAREECGLALRLSRHIGTADELVFAADEDTYYRKRCTFFLADLVETVGQTEPDHELIWLSPGGVVTQLRHKSQRWAAVSMWLRTTPP